VVPDERRPLGARSSIVGAITDFRNISNGRVCQGKKFGVWIQYRGDEQSYYESRADQVELDCLRANLQRAGCKCRTLIRERINTVRDDPRLGRKKRL
jgi:hypothetical protein